MPFRDLVRDPSRLAKEVLAEIPKQLTDYFLAHNIRPNPKSMQGKQEIQIRNKMRNQMAQMMRQSNMFLD